ncbi:MAG: chemotaxis protein CheB [Xanthomonadales bacterium]|nr:chemotaxis protein CheB [Xanthomonadales bacterium]
MNSAAAPKEPRSPSTAVRIVGIGASAGGLVALEHFLAEIPSDSGIAWIVVQHLDPTQKALLSELLQRVTPMPVREATQDMRIQPDGVYVIPPNTELSVADGLLKLAQPAEPRGQRLPINVLFSSLASERGESAIAVILSGMGSDGTLGAQAVKAMGGLIVAQDPASAQFDSMPRSAIDAGCVDIVAPARDLPARIMAYTARVPGQTGAAGEEAQAVPDTEPLQQIVTLLRQRTRHDFSLYKSSTLQRRIERRMAIHRIAPAARYVELLEQNPQEIDLLFKELLIGVTGFFRDAEVWACLAETALPDLLARRQDNANLRAWSIGCSTGEEAYSLAMVFSEAAERMPQPYDLNLQIFASDLSADAIATARRGKYPLSIRDSVSGERLKRFFTAHDSYYQINQNIRDLVLFAQHDVVLDAPFTKLDLVACRNLLIYFDPQLQRRLLPLFHYSLRSGGVLLLGNSETVGRLHHLFEPIQPKLRLYRRRENVSRAGLDFTLRAFSSRPRTLKEPAVSPPPVSMETADSLQAAADHVLLQVYAPAAVLLNSEGDIVYVNGRTGKYLEPAAGKANWNIHAMVNESLRAPLASALKTAAGQQEPVYLHGLPLSTPPEAQRVDVTVQAFDKPAVLHGMIFVVFRDVAVAPADSGRGKGTSGEHWGRSSELQQYHTEIETLREEARAAREQSQSYNEELQSTNEELQSTNEELTTSKEEMQSMNEELQTINSELHSKLDALALAQSDLQNLLNSIEIAILFLDRDLNVRRYTDLAATVINLRETDIGRPLSDLTTSLQYDALHDDALETLRTLAAAEKQILSTDGRWFSVRIMPYQTLDKLVDGVVITLVDITATKELESALRQQSKP